MAAIHLTQTPLRKAWKGSYPHLVESLHFLVQGRIDILHVEKWVTPDLAQQVFGEVAHVVLAEVPLAQDAAGDDSLGILVAALAEILAQVLAVPQPLDVIWPNPGRQAGSAQARPLLHSHHCSAFPTSKELCLAGTSASPECSVLGSASTF